MFRDPGRDHIPSGKEPTDDIEVEAGRNMFQAVIAFVSAPDDGVTTERLLQQEPGLLTDFGTSSLYALALDARLGSHEDLARAIDQRRWLLDLCRRHGVRVGHLVASVLNPNIRSPWQAEVQQITNAIASRGSSDRAEALDRAVTIATALAADSRLSELSASATALARTLVAQTLLERFEVTHNEGDIRSASHWLRDAANLEEDASERARYLDSLGDVLSMVFAANEDPHQIDAALAAYTAAARTAPKDSYHHALYEAHRGRALTQRAQDRGDLKDLRTGIAILEQALERLIPFVPGYPELRYALGLARVDELQVTGDKDAGDRAIIVLRELAEATGINTAERASALNALGAALTARYQSAGELIDLEDAISVYVAAVEANPVSAKYALSLAGALNYRFRRLQTIEDLDRAIATLSGIHKTTVDAKDYAKVRNNLSISYYERYRFSNSKGDIDAAILAAQEAVASASKTEREYALYLATLGSALEVRSADLNEVADLENSIKVHSEALQLAAGSGRTLAGFRCNLANALVDRYFYAGKERDALAATDFYRQASKEGLQRAPESGLNAARSWMYFAGRRRKWHEVVEAYDYAAPIQDQLQRLQAVRSHKEAWLRSSRGLSEIAALALTTLGHTHRAVGVLEAGRARLLSEVFEREHPAFDRLTQLGRINLVSRYHEAVLKLKNEVAPDSDVPPHFPAGFQNGT